MGTEAGVERLKRVALEVGRGPTLVAARLKRSPPRHREACGSGETARPRRVFPSGSRSNERVARVVATNAVHSGDGADGPVSFTGGSAVADRSSTCHLQPLRRFIVL